MSARAAMENGEASEVEMGSSARLPARVDEDDDEDEEDLSLLGDGAGDRRPRRSPSLSNDLVVCSAAWTRLSCPTRWILLLVAGGLLVLATYKLGMGEGVREQTKYLGASMGDGDEGAPGWRVFGGDDDDRKEADGPGDAAAAASGGIKHFEGTDEDRAEIAKMFENEPPTPQGTFTEDLLNGVRSRARYLLFELEEYYGGKEKAKSMLVESWQASWMLEDEEFKFWDGNEGDGDGGPAGDDDDTTYDDDGKRRHLKRNKDGKKNKNKNHDDNSTGNNDDAEKKKNKNNKKKGVKEGKVLVNPDKMSQEELEQHHHHRRRRTSKLVTTMARAMVDPYQNRFTIGTIGSSVAAGHDNCHYDSYESQLERTLTPVFAAAAMGLEVQNAGEGGGCGDDHQNQVFCVTHNVSPDVDVVHYSWTYFEKAEAEVQREQLIRWAQRMEKRPMVHHLVARGKANTCNGDSRANVDLDMHYSAYGYNAFCIQTGLYFGGHDYDADLEAGINRFGWKHRGDGYHNTTRYGEELPDDDPRKASLGTVYRNWHPGPLGFQIAADAFAYVYMKGLVIALDIIEGDMKAGVDVRDRWFGPAEDRRLEPSGPGDKGRSKHQRSLWSQATASGPPPPPHRPLPPLGDMPEPLFCDPLYCSVSHPPHCLNYEKPTFGTPGVSVRQQSGWQVAVDDNGWNHMVGKVDIAIIKAKHDPEWERKCTHLDACGGIWAADSNQETLTFELPAADMTAGLVFICGCCGKNVGASMFIENEAVTIRLNGRVIEKSKMDVYPTKKCVRLLKQFGDDGFEKEDEMLLSIKVADQDPNLEEGDGPPIVKISHVVAL